MGKDHVHCGMGELCGDEGVWFFHAGGVPNVKVSDQVDGGLWGNSMEVVDELSQLCGDGVDAFVCSDVVAADGDEYSVNHHGVFWDLFVDVINGC